MDTSVVAFDLIWAATIVLFLMIIFAPVACSLSYIMMVLAVVGEKWLDRVQGAWYVVYVPPLGFSNMNLGFAYCLRELLLLCVKSLKILSALFPWP